MNGFFHLNEEIDQNRNFAKNFHIKGNAFRFIFKTKMKCLVCDKQLFKNESSIEFNLYEDEQQNVFLFHLIGASDSFVFQGDSFQSDDVVIIPMQKY